MPMLILDYYYQTLPRPWHRDAASFGRMVVLTNTWPSNLLLSSGPHHNLNELYVISKLKWKTTILNGNPPKKDFRPKNDVDPTNIETIVHNMTDQLISKLHTNRYQYIVAVVTDPSTTIP